jgi:spore coat protein U-like protein
MKRALVKALFMLAMLFGAQQAHALCTALLGCSCSANTTNATMAFGNYNPLVAGNVDSASNVKISCGGVAGLAITYRLDFTKGGGTSHSARRLASGSNTLNYNLYTDNTYTTVLGDGTGTTAPLTGGIGLDLLGLSPPNTHWMYGRIDTNQRTAIPGNYVDTITITVTYQ